MTLQRLNFACVDDRLLDKIAEPFNLKLPEYTSMRAMVEEVLEAVESYGEVGFEADGPLYTTNWVRMTDNPGDNVLQLHRFLPDGRLQMASDGIVETNQYELAGEDRIIIAVEKPGKKKDKEKEKQYERFLFEMAFMDKDFLILRRHGNDDNFVNKYLFYCDEPIGSKLTWDEALEKLVAKYRNNLMPWWLVLLALMALGGMIIYFS